MLGSSVARHLAEAGASVTLIGPGEPEDRRTHQGVFASHYDDTRITRVIDPDPLRAWLAHRSVPAFRRLEADTSVGFYFEVGHLWVGSPEEVAELAGCGQRFDLGCVGHSAAELTGVFPGLRPPGGLDGLFQVNGAGHLDPRAYVRAEGVAFTAAGGEVYDQVVTAVREVDGAVEVTTARRMLTADRVVLATGAFFGHGDTPATSLPLTVATHTMVHAEIGIEDSKRLSYLPSIIVKPAEENRHCFVLPPKVDEHGRTVLKIGDSRQGRNLEGEDLAQWYRGDGDPKAASHQVQLLVDLLPGLEVRSLSTVPCATTYTPTGHPMIDDLTGRVSALLGGNGYAAKCAPALGELAASRLLDGSWNPEVDRDLFRLNGPGAEG